MGPIKSMNWAYCAIPECEKKESAAAKLILKVFRKNSYLRKKNLQKSLFVCLFVTLVNIFFSGKKISKSRRYIIFLS